MLDTMMDSWEENYSGSLALLYCIDTGLLCSGVFKVKALNIVIFTKWSILNYLCHLRDHKNSNLSKP